MTEVRRKDAKDRQNREEIEREKNSGEKKSLRKQGDVLDLKDKSDKK